MYNFIIAQIFGFFGILFNVFSMQMKTKKNIMIMLLGLSLSSAFNFLFLNSISASLISFFAALETFINFLFDSKDKKVPIYIIAFYVVVNLILGFYAYNGILDILPIVCSLLFCVIICTKKEKNIKKLTFLNQIFWLIYDIKVKAYMFCMSNILTLISVIVSLERKEINAEKL